MIKIRPNIFETNSSSNDYYNDDRDDYYYNSYTTTHQDVIIILKFSENVTDDRLDFILSNICDECIEDIDQLFADYYEDECEDVDVNDDWLILKYKLTFPVSWIGGSSGDRYSPPVDPDPVWDDEDIGGIPLKNENFPEKEKIKQQLMEIFKKHEYNEIIGIENIYADEIDEDEAWENATID